jgi:hypothetical protein
MEQSIIWNSKNFYIFVAKKINDIFCALLKLNFILEEVKYDKYFNKKNLKRMIL